MDLHLINEGRHEQLWDVLGAHVHHYARRSARPSPAPRSRSGRPAPAACGSTATSTAGTAASTRCASSAPPASGSCSCPASGTGTRYKFAILGADGQWREKADPMAFHTEVPPATSSVVFESTYTWGDDELAGRRGRPRSRCTRPMSVYEVHLGSWRTPRRRAYSYAELADELVGLPRRPRLHPRGVPAGDGAPVRRLVGLPGHVVLRPDRALRRPRRLPLPRRPAAPGRHRRDPGLGAGALPQGRLRAGPLRRHPALRGPQPLARRAPRLGHLRLQLRAPRGPQLPGRQRALLARGVPRRRAARRRGRLDALPRLLPRARAVDAQRARRPREPRGGAVPPGDERHRLQAGARRDHDRRGVHLLAGRHPADLATAAWASASSGTWAGCTTRSAYIAARAGAPRPTTTAR